MSRSYSESDVENYVNEALALSENSPIYNVRFKNGMLHYTMCEVNRHWIRKAGKEYRVIAADSTCVCAVADSGVSVLVHAHELSSWEVFEKPKQPVISAPTDYEIPPIGSVHTHKSGRTYLVYGYGNMHANNANRERYPVAIHYIGVNGYTWSKSLESFKESMIAGGTFSFNEGVEFEYMGICHNGALGNGFLTHEIQKLMLGHIKEA